MSIKFPKIVATSGVRGSRQTENHGGVFTFDFEKQEVEQVFDWDASEIDLKGSSGDGGMRGIAFSDDDILIAASNVLLRCDRSFKIKTMSRNYYLNDCHEICRYEQTIFLTSPDFDSLLAFDLDKKEYVWGFHLLRQYDQWAGYAFDPQSNEGPLPVNEYHVNMVHVDSTGIYLSGLRTNALLHINNDMEVSEICSLPAGAHNARPFRDGLLLNDTESDCVRYIARDGKNQAFKIISYDEGDLETTDHDVADDLRQGFGRGLCLVGDRFVAGGSSPSTISLYDFETSQIVGFVNLTMDVRNAIHGLEVWPYND